MIGQIDFQGTLLLVDQSLASSGVVCMSFGSTTTLRYWLTLKSLIALDGPVPSLDRAAQLSTEFSKLIQFSSCHLDGIVYETPPLSMNGLQRPESSLLAAAALRIAAHQSYLPAYAISANRAKNLITGNSNAKKKDVREVLLNQFPFLQNHRLNEHQIDACALGLSYAFLHSSQQSSFTSSTPPSPSL
jgi:Holliday junction resolvasome RuvABC endonuclease subunit